MKKLYILILVALATLSSTAQIVNIPDANFKAYLLYNVDTNNDGEIQESEAVAVTNTLWLNDLSISDLTGINAFINIERLYCNNNQLTSLDVSNLHNLTNLRCSNNQLTSITFSSSVNLERLECDYNQLNTLNIPGTTDYFILYAGHNQITEATINFSSIVEGIDLSYNNLTSFTIANVLSYDGFNLNHNQLSDLQITNCEFDYLLVSYNNLSSIQFNGDITINYGAAFNNNQFSDFDLTGVNFGYTSTIYLGNNVVDKLPTGISPGNISYSSNNTSFDLGGYSRYSSCDPDNVGNVEIFDSPNLQTLILKNGFNHTYITCNEGGTVFQNPALDLSITNCPNLSFICVDEGERASIQSSVNLIGLGNQIEVNSYCSFVPGGTYYTIQGNTKFDSNNNGCDVNDINFGEMMFSITDGTNTGSVIANETGTYILPVQQGTHVVTPVLENPSYFTISPTSATVTFPAATSPFTQDFCVTANGVHNDVEISMMPIGVARPGFDATYKIVYKNKGNQVSNGTVGLSFDDAKMDLVSASPVNTGSATNSLSWDYSNLNPFETREITVVFNINSLMETPAVNDGDVLNYTATIVGATDEMPSDNTFTLNQTVVNSFDPNDKTCLEGTTITPSMVGNYVHYVIRFENTGTFAAQNVVVSDVIDTTKFNIGSLVTQSSSHPFVTRINSGKVEFIFENINLPFDDANNDGYVAFKIKTKPTLVLGDTFSNSANIYFDYNFPITTNTVMTTVSALAAQDFDFGSYFSVYPNPAKDVLHLATKNEIGVKSVSIYNTLGQMVLVVTNPENNATIDVANLKAGTYFIKVTTDKGTANTKFIKE